MSESRSPERLRFHYEVERALAAKLKAAPRAERLKLYGALYDELFRQVADHPQLTAKAGAEWRRRSVEEQLENLRPWLLPGRVFLELGAGDGALTKRAATFVAKSWALDVSELIGAGEDTPPNFARLLSDGIHVGLPDASVDVAYSHQLLEHLHPDDARAQLAEVLRVLKPGGLYLCVTPSRLTGPHDISGFFEDTATGFHLREYSLRELAELFTECGYVCRTVVAQVKGRRVELPLNAVLRLERAVERLPVALRRAAARKRPLRWALNTLQLVAEKP